MAAEAPSGLSGPRRLCRDKKGRRRRIWICNRAGQGPGASWAVCLSLSRPACMEHCTEYVLRHTAGGRQRLGGPAAGRAVCVPRLHFQMQYGVCQAWFAKGRQCRPARWTRPGGGSQLRSVWPTWPKPRASSQLRIGVGERELRISGPPVATATCSPSLLLGSHRGSVDCRVAALSSHASPSDPENSRGGQAWRGADGPSVQSGVAAHVLDRLATGGRASQVGAEAAVGGEATLARSLIPTHHPREFGSVRAGGPSDPRRSVPGRFAARFHVLALACWPIPCLPCARRPAIGPAK